MPRGYLLVGLLMLSTAMGQVRVWQDSIPLPTYAEGDPDPQPQFAAIPQNGSAANYPYPFRSHISTAPKDRSVVTWRTLNIENEYLSCRILPDLGGHLYNCTDKLSQREIFHAPDVIKKAMIGLRGAWISAGIEPNFPAAHSRVSASPVAFALRQDSDGSAAVIVGDTDRVTGMEWQVEYRLRPATAALEQRITFYNPTPERKPYLWWNNAAIEWDDPGIRFIFPTHVVATHYTSALDTWPVNSAGVDMSLVENDKAETSWFAFGSREPFMGIYKPKFRSGLAHYADPRVVTGKKLWIMAQDQKDQCRQRLGDGGNVYVELQAGLFTDQETYAFLGPEQSRSFTENWIPFRDMDGLTRATPDLVLYAARRGAQFDIQLSGTHAIANAKIRIRGGGRPATETTAGLGPGSVWKTTQAAASPEPFEIEVADSSGRVLLRHREGIWDAMTAGEVKIGAQKQIDWSGPETQSLLLQRGDHNESLGQTPAAESDYDAGLKRWPKERDLLTAAARLELALGRDEEAAAQLKTALGNPGVFDETLYMAGVADGLKGLAADARAALMRIPASSAFHAAAQIQGALLDGRTGDFAAALKLLDADGSGPLRGARIAALRAALSRRLGDASGAREQIKSGLVLAPENPLLRFEGTQNGIEDPALWSFLAGDAERVLDIADQYMSLGFWQDALTALTHDYSSADPKFLEPGAVPPAKSALAAYYTAFCRQQLKLDPSSDLSRASTLGTLYQFPSRVSSYEVLNAALERNASDATAHALLGNLDLYSLKRKDALEQWSKAISLNSKLEVERKSRDQLLAVMSGKVETSTQPAVISQAPPAINGTGPTDRAEEAMLASASAENPQNPGDVFRGSGFASEKQPVEVRRAYIEMQLQTLLARSRKRNCGDDMQDRIDALGMEDTGIPFTFFGFGQFMRAAHFQYYLGVVQENCGNSKQAEKYWSKVAKLKEAPDSPDYAYPLLAAKRLKQNSAPALAEAHKNVDRSGNAANSTFNQALLLRAEGKETEAAAALSKAAQASPDVFVRYLARVELRADSR